MDENEDATSGGRRRPPGGRRTGRSGEEQGEGAMLIRLARVRPGYDQGRRPTPPDDDGGEEEDGEEIAAVPAKRQPKPLANPGRAPLPQRTDGARLVGDRATLDRLVASSRRSMSPVLLSFLLAVALPTLLASLYFAFVASPQYASEFRFSVRSQEGNGSMDQMRSAAAVNPMAVIADNFLVSDFAESRDVVDKLEAEIGLRRLFGADHIDWWSRFDRTGSAEKLVHYWADMVDAHFDMTTGINVIAVRAFSPQDAHMIAVALQRMCEELVNGISERARRTQMQYAEDQVARAEAKLRAIRDREREFRTRVKSVDAAQTAAAQIALASKIEGDLSTIRTEYDMVSKYLEPESPRLKVLRDQIASTEAQLAAVNGRVGGMDANGAAAVADAVTISEYENIKTDADLALKIYEAALTSFEQARLRAVTDQLFLATFVQPSRPEQQARPRLVRETFLFFLSALGIWVVGTLIYFSMRDHSPS